MTRLLRGHALQAVSESATAAFLFASLSGQSEVAAVATAEEALRHLIKATIVALEATGIDPDEVERRALYLVLCDYVGHPRPVADTPWGVCR